MVHVKDTPPQKKIKVEMASPGSMSNVLSPSSCESVDPIELLPFTPMVKCALRDGDCNSTIQNMVSALLHVNNRIQII